jgi:hypothetical protein
MPPMIKRSDLSKISRALELQRKLGGPSLRLSNRCMSIASPAKQRGNSNTRLIPKPMTQEDTIAVVKLTGFSPFLETKFVRP